MDRFPDGTALILTGSGRAGNRAGGLAATLRERTLGLHRRAERTGIVHALLRGKASRRGYALLLRNLLPAYQRMEEGLERHRRVPGVRAIAQPAVYRTRALKQDLRAIEGAAWKQSLPLLSAGEDYARSIAAVAETAAIHLIGHAYVRYLGDLNGGRILCRLLVRSMDLRPSQLSFYDYPDIDDIGAFKLTYRSALDGSVSEIAEMEGVVQAAVDAFEMNIAVSQAVQIALAGAAADGTDTHRGSIRSDTALSSS